MGEVVRETIAGIEVEIAEDRSRPLMFLLRMAGPSSGLWSSVWQPIEARFTPVTFDLHQFEAAQRLDDAKEMFKVSSDACAAIADELGEKMFHVFGWNGGTHIALRAAADYPQRVASLILLDVFAELPDMRHVDKAVAFKKLLFEQDRELYAYYWTMAGLSDSFIANNFDKVETIAKNRLKNDRFINQNTDAYMRWVNALRRDSLEPEEWEKIRAPTLILATKLDRWNAGPSVEMAEMVQSRLGNARLVVLEGVGGHFLIEDPDRFVEVFNSSDWML